MKLRRKLSLFVGLIIGLMLSGGAESLRGQTVAYLYPAGGQIGTKFEMLIAGNDLWGAENVVVTGGGVEMKILERPRYGNFQHQDPYGGKCVAVWRAMMEEESRVQSFRDDPAKMEESRRSLRENRRKRTESTPVKSDDIPTPTDEEIFRSSVYWHRLEKPTIEDLQLIYYEYDGGVIDFQRKEHSQFGSTLMVEVTIDKDAAPGVRELYVSTPGGRGLSRATRFWVGKLPEVSEIEPNDGVDYEKEWAWGEWRRLFKKFIELKTQEVPVVINGQIKPGDIDQFYLKAKEGQRLVFDMQARSTAPYVANAVPGYFAAVITIYDSEGKKLKYSENFRFDQNPLMFYRIPKDGKYMIEIQDSIFRGRNDFVYRLSVGEFPVVYSHFPLGGKQGESTTINLMGGNLPAKTVTPDFAGNINYDEIREIAAVDGVTLIRPIRYMVETLPIFVAPIDTNAQNPGEVTTTTTTGKSPATAKVVAKPPVTVPFPTVIYGRIEKIGEIGSYQFEGKTGQAVAVDVTAQPLGSALDAAVEILDPTGKVLAFNDDRADSKGPNIGWETMHSDPNLVTTLPADGRYTVRIFGMSRKAGPECYYRLRISEPQPNFDLCVIPSTIRFNGKNATFDVRIFRKEGFNSEITLSCLGDLGIKISRDGIIGAEEQTANFTMVIEDKLPESTMPIEMVGVAQVNEKTITNKVLPSDDWEQAFIYHHWVPAKEMMATQR